MTESTPLVTVLMPAYNASAHLREAIESILAQTFTAFELIVVDDGSTDGTGEIVRTYEDHRIRLVTQDHRGIDVALNRGILEGRAPLIARMDSDDISHPQRLEAQVGYLRDHPEVALVGCWFHTFGNQVSDIVRPPVHDFQIKYVLPESNTFCGGSVVFRRSVLAHTGIFRLPVAEDYDLWLRISERAAVHNLPSGLYKYRVSDTQTVSVLGSLVQQYARLSKTYAIQRMLFGRDSAGCVLTQSRHCGRYTRRAVQRAAQRALQDGRVDLATKLIAASLRVDPRGTTAAWLGASLRAAGYVARTTLNGRSQYRDRMMGQA